MRGKQVSPPAPFRNVPFGSRWEVTTHAAGMNPASLVTSLPPPNSLPLARGYGGGSIQTRPAPWPTLSGMPCLVVHGGAGAPPMAERPERQAAVERAVD